MLRILKGTASMKLIALIQRPESWFATQDTPDKIRFLRVLFT
jgi:hypothetical protein